MIPAALQNPFHTHKADDTVTLPAGDVPELHAHVLAKCYGALAQARRTNTSVGLLVVGEAGSGKSHLIAQLRSNLTGDPMAALCAIRLGKAYAGRLWRHLRERLVEELLRPYVRQEHGANGLLRILRNRFPKWAANAQGPSGALMDWLVGRSAHADLTPSLDEYARGCSLDYNLVQVLPRVAIPDLTRVAHDWLQGKQLGAKDLHRLGLPPVFPSEQEQEAQAQEVVLSFLRLAGEQTNLVLCFDEVEAIQSGTWDAAVLRQFTTLATTLLAEVGPRIIITCVRPRLLNEITKAVELSNVQKIGQEQTTIPHLSREQTVRVAVSRLDAEPSCTAARLQHPGDPCWPLGQKFVTGLFDRNPRSLTPRHLISACRAEFDRLQTGKPSEPVVQPRNGSTPAVRASASPPPVTPQEFSRGWEKLRTRYLENLGAIPFDTVLAIGLPWLVHLTGMALVRVQDGNPLLRDVNLVFQPTTGGGKPVGISFCNHPPRPLPSRLVRVMNQWETARGKDLDSMIVLRSEVERTTRNAASKLEGLRKAGIRVILLDRRQLAELASFQLMMTKCLEGKLLRYGALIEPAQYDDWVKTNLSEAVKELLQLVFKSEPAAVLSVPATAGK